MSNPLRLFRKYQAALLVAFGVVLMFAFVIGPVLSDYLQTRAGRGGGANPVVVSWQGGKLREADMARLRPVQLLVTRFLRQLVSRVRVMKEDVEVERKGQTIRLIQGRTYPLLGRSSGEDGMTFQIAVDGEMVTVPRQKGGGSTPQVEAVRPRPGVQMITQSTGEEDLVRRMLLAEEAKQRGMVVSEGAVIDYLDTLGDVTADARPDYVGLLKRSTNGRLSWSQFLEHMSMELAAQRMLIMSQTGLMATSPHLLYRCYNKLNRRVTAELLAVNVRDFLDEVREPNDQELRALYEEGKDRFPNPESPEPGFKQREKIKFQYVAGTFDDFLQREMDRLMPTITDEEIERHYEENKDNYEVTELPEESPVAPHKELPKKEIEKTTPDEAADDEDDEPADETPDDAPDDGDDEPAEATSKPDAVGNGPAEKKAPAHAELDQPDGPKAEPDEAEAGKAGKKTAAEGESPKRDPDAKKQKPNASRPRADKGAEADGDEAKPAGADQAAEERSNDKTSEGQTCVGQASVGQGVMTWVSYNQPAEATQTPSQENAKASEPAPAVDENATDAEPQEKTTAGEAAENGPEENGPEENGSEALPKTDTAEEQPAAGEKEAKSADQTAQPEPSAEGKAEGRKEAVEEPDQYKPLDGELRAEIREEIARDQAREPAQEELEAAISTVRAKLQTFSRELRLSEALEEKKAPEPLDIEAIAKENNLRFRETPRWDRLDVRLIRERDPEEGDPPFHELARATETVWSQRGQTQRSLLDIAFGGELETYMPRQFVDGVVMPTGFPIPPQKMFLYWRVAVDPERTPALEEVGGRVIHEWKMKRALPLAQAKAQEMAERANQANQPLVDLFAESAEAVIRTTPFSWMTRGSVPGRTGGRPMLSSITGMVDNQPVSISGADNDFMRSVFALEVNEVGMATNAPETFVYVVRVDSEDRSDEARREAFFESGPTQDINSLVQEQQSRIAMDWLEGLEEKYDLQWAREPQTNWDSRRPGA